MAGRLKPREKNQKNENSYLRRQVRELFLPKGSLILGGEIPRGLDMVSCSRNETPQKLKFLI